MRFETTIEARIKGVTLFQTDVTIDVDYQIDRWGELHWQVDQYSVEGKSRVWDDTAQKWRDNKFLVAVPEKLAEVFDDYLDREKIDERLREALIEADEMKRDEGDAEHAAAYRASVL